MDITEFVNSINKKEYSYQQFTKEEIKTAKENGFVIVYRKFDNFMKFDGAITGGVSCFNGRKVYVCNERTSYGLISNDYKYINALLVEDDHSIYWSYETDIPHKNFIIYKDNKPYCKGIVFKNDEL